MSRIIAVGDVHGCSQTFKKLLVEEINVLPQDKIYCLGDYIDRGTDSKGVIDFIIELRASGYNIHTLRGNHEQLMMDSEKSEEAFEHWYMNGGNNTLQSFGIDLYSEMPAIYKSFFSTTKLCIQSGPYIFVHAGLNFSNEDIFKDKEAMLWIRDFNPYQKALGIKKLIHGHTPASIEVILNQQDNCINIDGGCVFAQNPNLGKLVAVDLTNNKFHSINNCE